MMRKGCWIAGIAITAVLGLACIILAAVLPGVIHNKIKEKAADQAILGTSNEDSWAHIPGKMDVVVKRDYYLYDISMKNPMDLFSAGNDAKIEVNRIGPFSYFEREDDLNIAFSDDKEKVTSNPWDYYVHDGTSNDDSMKVTNINLGAYGVWYQVCHTDTFKLATTVLYDNFSSMFSNIQSLIYSATILNNQFKGSTAAETKNNIKTLMFAGIDDALFEIIYVDPTYGIQSALSFSYWIQAALNFPEGSAGIVQSYFLLTNAEIATIVKNLQVLTDDTYAVIEQAYGCTNPQCLAQLQTATGKVLSDPPAGVTSQGSIINYNSTTIYAPELGYFQQQVFVPTLLPDEQAEYKAVTWDMDLLDYLMAFKMGEAVLSTRTLFNIANIGFIFDVCQGIVDQSNLEQFNPVADKFHLTTKQARILWNYLVYLVDSDAFAEMPVNNPGGSYEQFVEWKGMAGVADIGTDSLHDTTSDLTELVGPLTHGHALWNSVKDIGNFSKSPATVCVDIVVASGIAETTAEEMCNFPPLKWTATFDLDVYGAWIEMCREQYSDIAMALVYEKKLLTPTEYDTLCSFTVTLPHQQVKEEVPKAAAATTINSLFSTIMSDVAGAYGCTGPRGCTNKELMMMQWGSCSVTLGFPDVVGLKKGYLMEQYLPNTVPAPITYCGWQFATNDRKVPHPIAFEDVRSVMNFSGMLSDDMNGGYVFGLYKEFQTDPLKTGKQYDLYTDFLVYLVRDVAMGGLTRTRTAKEWLFGYTDDFVAAIVHQNPLAGGDPTANPHLGFEKNMTTPEDALSRPTTTLWTGKNHKDLVGNYFTYEGSETIQMWGKTYDGFTVQNGYTNPWGTQVPFKGSAGTRFQIDIQKDDKINFYIDDLYRQGDGIFVDSFHYHDLPVYRYNLGPSMLATSDYNKKVYYSLKYDGMGNQTTVEQAPVFVSKPYFWEAEEAGKNTTIYGPDNKVLLPGPSGQTYFYVEPYSGGAVQANEELQGSIQLSPNVLIPDCPNGFLPMFYLHRYGGLDGHQISSTFGELITAMKVQKIFPLVAYPVGAAFLLASAIIGFFFYKKRKAAKLMDSENPGAYATLTQ
eukprot:CAMPEP_0114972588 /NCGR_PEP_ID=MMETSP0216-20121206/480_1 /TAXON_ID=223996 /ORGANISM="Protocruzia adherens, Strain Boccale" /LENGTH=1080 /DNA_ID=CAMNT_0002332981 /DNA_START=101 /DNA_END=3343 /DNA_ORIENTATION=-